ncbi:MAG: HipA N-terminal domain-containing protein [Rhodocyclaceae bacterium]|nr:HipA N-terminal domain-containing protein [Rhodocyclaceae bacterium]
MNGRYVGRWDITAQGRQSLQYDDQWVHSEVGRPVSLSMPLRPSDRPYRARRSRPISRTCSPTTGKFVSASQSAFTPIAPTLSACLPRSAATASARSRSCRTANDPKRPAHDTAGPSPKRRSKHICSRCRAGPPSG